MISHQQNSFKILKRPLYPLLHVIFMSNNTGVPAVLLKTGSQLKIS